MKKLIFFFGITLLFSSCAKEATIFVVRHAEKDLVYKGDDHFRPLNTAGHQRAGILAKRLANEKIAKIYATEYLRVQQTGDSLRINQKIDTAIYSAKTAYFFDKIKQDKVQGKNILIIGHSNTVPEVIRFLGVKFDLKIILDTEYDNLYLVKMKGKKVIDFKAEKF
ncbi:histidine phosphatase family protein [Arcicella rosea]|uniref:Phosphohistidine phosphatase SixA n=1 Tax=Arcicella rosea TaxID=502909 RepID=A0A841EG21_9BACT|nr:phosphoglycerate mutase family protein [Arcicella rosea]MBB6002272.1 phosphohistidine phosphatase SixA [Arcicella rosea]